MAMPSDVVNPGTGLVTVPPGTAPPPAGIPDYIPVDPGNPLDPEMLAWYTPWLSLFALPRYNPDLLIQSRGWDAMDDLLTNTTYASAIRIKKYATLYKGLSLRPAIEDVNDPDYDKARRICDFCTYLLDSIGDPLTGDRQPLRMVLWQIMDAFHAGFSVQERICHTRQKAGTPVGSDPDLPPTFLALTAFASKRPRQIGFELDAHTLRPVNLTSQTYATGWIQPVSLKRCVLYTYQPMNGLPYGMGDARAAWKHVNAVQELTRWWGLAEEFNGIPRVKATTTNPDRAYQSRLRMLLETWRQGAPMVIPPDVTIEILQALSGSLDSFRTAIKYHEEQVWTNILGQTLTTMQGSGPGSYALGAVHENTREFFFKFCRDDVEHIVEDQILCPLVTLNYGEQADALTPKASLGQWDNDERNLLATFYETLIGSGVIAPDEPFIRADLGIQPGDPTVTASGTAPDEPGIPPTPAPGGGGR
jgi:hypothetical protein